MKIVIESKSEVSQNTLPKMKIVIESKSQGVPVKMKNRVQIRGVPEYPPKMKIVISPNPRCPRNTPANQNCHRVQIWGMFQNTPENENCHTVQIQGVPELPPKMKIVIESKSKVFQSTPQNENCHRIQIQGVPEYSPPQNENCHRVQIWRIPPNENCQRVQIWGVPKYSPQMKIVRESKSEVSQNTPPKWKLS